MDFLSQLEPGYYGGMLGLPGLHPTRGGLTWSKHDNLLGWFVVDSVAYVNGNITEVSLRFGMSCTGTSQGINGAMSWNASNHDLIPTPIVPVPSDLWTPPRSVLSFSDNYLYMQQFGHLHNSSFLTSDAVYRLHTAGRGIAVAVLSSQTWKGYFQPMYSFLR